MADWLWETVEDRGNNGGRVGINLLGAKSRSVFSRILAEKLKRALGYQRLRAEKSKKGNNKAAEEKAVQERAARPELIVVHSGFDRIEFCVASYCKKRFDCMGRMMMNVTMIDFVYEVVRVLGMP